MNKIDDIKLPCDVTIQEIHPIIEQELKAMLSEVEKCSQEEVYLNSWHSMATELAMCKAEEPRRDSLIRCSHCGDSYYMENHSISTAMYCPPIYKDGVNINPDRNITTTYCTCMNCGKNFSYKR